MVRSLSCVLAVLAACRCTAAQDWHETDVLFYTVAFTDQDVGEVDAVGDLLRGFHEQFCEAAGVDGSLVEGSAVRVELHPRGSGSVPLGHAALEGGPRTGQGESGYHGTIRLPGPSAHDGSLTSTSGHAMDRRYFDKLLAHEVAPVYLELYARSRGAVFHAGCPDWFVEGAEEYFAVRHSTEYWRGEGVGFYYRRLARDPASVDTQYGLNLQDRYNDGFLVVDFLREEFGERVVFAVLADPDRSFGGRLAGATEVPFGEFQSRLESWKARKVREFSEAR